GLRLLIPKCHFVRCCFFSPDRAERLAETYDVRWCCSGSCSGRDELRTAKVGSVAGGAAMNESSSSSERYSSSSSYSALSSASKGLESISVAAGERAVGDR